MSKSSCIGLFSSDFAWKEPFSAKDLDNWGGVGEAVYHIALELNARGYDVEVFTSSSGNYSKTEYQNVTVHKYGKTILFADSKLSLELVYRHLREDIDLIHVHRGLPPGAIGGYLHTLISRKPFVFTAHGDLHYYEGLVRTGLLAGFEALSTHMLERADVVTTVTEEFCANSSYLESYRDETRVVPNGVKVPNLSDAELKTDNLDPHTNNTILFLGKLESRKNPLELIRAIPIVRSQFPDSQFVFLGEGELSKVGLDVATDIGVGKYVRFPGFVSEDAKTEYLRSADVFCLPSRNESFGLAAIEAASYGTPLVLSDIPCFRQLFDDAALFVDSNSPQEIGETISRILNTESLRRELSRAARERAEQYSWQSVTDKYVTIYQSLLS